MAVCNYLLYVPVLQLDWLSDVITLDKFPPVNPVHLKLLNILGYKIFIMFKNVQI